MSVFEERQEQWKLMARHDISVWRFCNPENCPNCGVRWSQLHPANNMVPHWTGDCIRPRAKRGDCECGMWAEFPEKTTGWQCHCGRGHLFEDAASQIPTQPSFLGKLKNWLKSF